MNQVAVIGPGDASPELTRLAHEAGVRLARLGVVVVTGGLGGVMATASRGAAETGGLTVGLLPGTDPTEANPWVRVVVPTGLGQARNALVVQSARVVFAIGGGWGTLSEVGLALRAGVPVVALHSWAPAGPDPAAPAATSPVHEAATLDDALAAIVELLDRD